jgi:hypothetical protein
LLNNVSESRKSTFYEDVDYGGDAYTPTNYPLIVSGSAYKAQIQDSNYSSGSAWTVARYSGTKLTSATYNTYTAGDISYGQKAVIDNYSDYFAVFSNNTSAFPEYPGGSNFKLISIVDINGQIYPLTGGNQYVDFVSNIFKNGTTATAYSKDISNQDTFTNLSIIQGGAKYQTILYHTGSSDFGYAAVYQVASTFTYQSATWSPLVENARTTITGDEGLYALLKSESNNTTPGGASGSIIALDLGAGSGIAEETFIYNKNTKEYITNTATPLTGYIKYEDTYLPLQQYDFLRIVPQNAASGDTLDNTYTGGISGSLQQIRSITIGDNTADVTPFFNPNTSSSLYLPQTLNPLVDTGYWQYRIFRRISDETSVVVTTNPQINVTSGEVGLLIPSNFNPNYDPIGIAKAAGLIS